MIPSWILSKEELIARVKLFSERRQQQIERETKKNKKSNDLNYNPVKRKEAHLRRNYGIGLEEFLIMLERQGNLCAICKEYMKIPNIDHDAKTEKVRELLCGPCNQGIGYLRENSRILLAAVDYLVKHKSDRRAIEISLGEELLKGFLK